MHEGLFVVVFGFLDVCVSRASLGRACLGLFTGRNCQIVWGPELGVSDIVVIIGCLESGDMIFLTIVFANVLVKGRYHVLLEQPGCRAGVAL
jgi:hypothetical protein